MNIKKSFTQETYNRLRKWPWYIGMLPCNLNSIWHVTILLICYTVVYKSKGLVLKVKVAHNTVNIFSHSVHSLQTVLKYLQEKKSVITINLLFLVSHVVPQQDPEYMEQPSPTNDSKHLQEDTERAISRAAAEQEERSPEALLNAVCKNTQTWYNRNTPNRIIIIKLKYMYQGCNG